MCCTWLAENTGRQKASKICHLGTVAQLCWAISLQRRHVSTIGKKLLSSNISSTRPHDMVNFGPLAAEIVSLVWGTPSNFNGFRVLAALLQRLRSTEANQTLHGVWPSPGLVHCIHIRGFLPRYTILPGAWVTLHSPRLALSYFGSVTARHLSSGRQPSFVVSSTGWRNLYSSGRPSRWTLAHILVSYSVCWGMLTKRFHCNRIHYWLRQ